MPHVAMCTNKSCLVGASHMWGMSCANLLCKPVCIRAQGMSIFDMSPEGVLGPIKWYSTTRLSLSLTERDSPNLAHRPTHSYSHTHIHKHTQIPPDFVIYLMDSVKDTYHMKDTYQMKDTYHMKDKYRPKTSIVTIQQTKSWAYLKKDKYGFLLSFYVYVCFPVSYRKCTLG